MAWVVALVLVVLWFLALIGQAGGDLKWLLLVMAVIALILQLFRGRRLV